MTAARLAARCVELLGAVDGPVVVMASPRTFRALAARVAVAPTDGAAAGAVHVLLGSRLDAPTRAARWRSLAGRLPAGAPVVVVEHNQPRRLGARLAGALLLLARGHRPARARQPVARELRDGGFTIERLRLAAGERVQLVLARRR